MNKKYTKPKVIQNKTLGLETKKISKTIKKRPIVRNVSFKIKKGEIVGLLGPNGAGKTTSFYIMIGLTNLDYGKVLLDGNDITELPMYKRAKLGIGYLPQQASIFRGLTVEKNIRAVLEVLKLPREEEESKLEELLAEFSISHLRNAPAMSLSGGERRRVEIARALALDPSFVLLDEPFQGIDPIAVGEIREMTSQLAEKNIGVLITDHNVRETLEIIDRGYIMNEGQVIAEGNPNSLVDNTNVRKVYLGDRFNL
jgi:lipopolysaccharide export system ATP-binding protein|tara:strand:- start:61 stop:825 length:765 start_codon:yes stop_codon:yes gene_type:complete